MRLNGGRVHMKNKTLILGMLLVLTIAFAGCAKKDAVSANQPVISQRNQTEGNQSTGTQAQKDISNGTDNKASADNLKQESTDINKSIKEAQDQNSNKDSKSKNQQNDQPISETKNNDNSKLIFNEQNNGAKSIFNLGMSSQDVISNLEKLNMEITSQDEITDNKNGWDYGHKVIWTEKLCFVFDKNDKLYGITVNGDIPTRLGLKNGDTLNNLEKLYGKSNKQYKFDWGTVLEYNIGGQYFYVSIQSYEDKVTLWGISKFKYDYNG
jgi:hypothetical protein